MIGMRCSVDDNHIVAVVFRPLNLFWNTRRICSAHIWRQITASASPFHRRTLRIKVEEEDALPLLLSLGCEVNSERAFANAAFLRDDCEYQTCPTAIRNQPAVSM